VAQERGQIHVAYRAVLLAAAIVVLGLLFRQLVTLLLAVVMTIIIAIPLAAVATRLERYKVPRPIGVALGLLAGLGTIAAVLALVIPAFVDQTEDFVNSVPGIVQSLEDRVRDVTHERPSELGDRVQEFAQRYTDNPAKLIGPITSIGLGLAGVLGGLVLILVTACFMAARPQPLVTGALRLFPPGRRPNVERVMYRLRESWIGWLQGVVVDMLITGSLLYIGLRIIGLDYAIVFAVFAALLVVVPYFGAVVGAVPPILYALTVSPGKALVVMAVYLIVQQVESNMVIPLVMSKRVKLHPALIAIGVVLVGQLFGVVGLFVAVPILSAVVICVEEFWVRPLEERHEIAQARELELPEGAEPAEASGEGPPGPPPGEEPAEPAVQIASRSRPR
jgi:predicted PurR-regulated permease PerM